jgi:hypothetical protein
MTTTINIKYNSQYTIHNASYDVGRQRLAPPIRSLPHVRETLELSTLTQEIYSLVSSHYARHCPPLVFWIIVANSYMHFARSRIKHRSQQHVRIRKYIAGIRHKTFPPPFNPYSVDSNRENCSELQSQNSCIGVSMMSLHVRRNGPILGLKFLPK